MVSECGVEEYARQEERPVLILMIFEGFVIFLLMLPEEGVR